MSRLRKAMLAATITLGLSAPAEARFSDREITCLAQAVYWEARGEPLSGQFAVAHVVINRMRHPDYPNTACGVVFQKVRGRCQFSWVCERPRRPRDGAAWQTARNVAGLALLGIGNRVGRATHFHATSVRPRWPGMQRVARISGHVFLEVAEAR